MRTRLCTMSSSSDTCPWVATVLAMRTSWSWVASSVSLRPRKLSCSCSDAHLLRELGQTPLQQLRALGVREVADQS